MYQKITNPKTGRKVSIYKKLGKKVILNYLKQIGGLDLNNSTIREKIKNKELNESNIIRNKIPRERLAQFDIDPERGIIMHRLQFNARTTVEGYCLEIEKSFNKFSDYFLIQKPNFYDFTSKGIDLVQKYHVCGLKWTDNELEEFFKEGYFYSVIKSLSSKLRSKTLSDNDIVNLFNNLKSAYPNIIKLGLMYLRLKFLIEDVITKLPSDEGADSGPTKPPFVNKAVYDTSHPYSYVYVSNATFNINNILSMFISIFYQENRMLFQYGFSDTDRNNLKSTYEVNYTYVTINILPYCYEILDYFVPYIYYIWDKKECS